MHVARTSVTAIQFHAVINCCLQACEHRLVLDVKGFTSAEGAAIVTLPRRQINVGTQRWFVIPRQTDAVPSDIQEQALSYFRLIHVASGKAVDARANGKAALFPTNAGSHSQCWRLLASCGGILMQNCSNQKVLSTTDGKSRVLGLVDHASLANQGNNLDKMLWQFDVHGFVVSRFDGRVVEASTASDGAALTTQNRKINVAGLGLMFKSLSTDSQIFRLIPISLSTPIPRPTAVDTSTPVSEVEDSDNKANTDSDADASVSASVNDDVQSLDVQSDSDLTEVLSALNHLTNNTDPGSHLHRDQSDGLDEALTALDELARKVSSSAVPDTPKGVDTALRTLEHVGASLRAGTHSSESDFSKHLPDLSSIATDMSHGNEAASTSDTTVSRPTNVPAPVSETHMVEASSLSLSKQRQLPKTPKASTIAENTPSTDGEDAATPLKEMLRLRRAKRSSSKTGSHEGEGTAAGKSEHTGNLPLSRPLTPLTASNPALQKLTDEVFKVLFFFCFRGRVVLGGGGGLHDTHAHTYSTHTFSTHTFSNHRPPFLLFWPNYY